MELKCNNCKNLDETSFCSYFKEYLPNGFAKLHFGGAIGEYHEHIRHTGKCGPGYQAKQIAELETRINIEGEAISYQVAYETRKRKQV